LPCRQALRDHEVGAEVLERAAGIALTAHGVAEIEVGVGERQLPVVVSGVAWPWRPTRTARIDGTVGPPAGASPCLSRTWPSSASGAGVVVEVCAGQFFGAQRGEVGEGSRGGTIEDVEDAPTGSSCRRRSPTMKLTRFLGLAASALGPRDGRRSRRVRTCPAAMSSRAMANAITALRRWRFGASMIRCRAEAVSDAVGRSACVEALQPVSRAR